MKYTGSEEIKKAIADYLAAHPDVSQTRLAQMAQSSAPVVSAWLRGKYHGDNHAVDEAMQAFLDREREKQALVCTSLEYTQTKAANRIHHIARLCHLDAEIGVVVSDPGMGKTFAIREYAKQNRGTLLVEVDPGDTAQAFFYKIVGALSLKRSWRVSDMFTEVCDAVRDSGRLLIIDEAESLDSRALDLIRRLHDHAHIGILLVGLPRLYANLRGRRGDFAQLYSRVATYVRLEPNTLPDFRSVLAKSHPEFIGLEKQCHEICKGRLRTLDKLVRWTVRIAKENRTSVDQQVLEKAAEALIF